MLMPVMRVSALGGTFAFFTPIDVRAVGLDTASAGTRKPVWILGAAQGVWYNAKHGEVPITAEDIDRMFENFSSGSYPPKPQELPIDYEHLSVKADRSPGDGKAAGWIKGVDRRRNEDLDRLELWALVDWNDDAAEAIRKKEYRGFSPLFHPNWKTHGNKELGVTLLGGALTNYQTIPDCVVTCSLDPNRFASVEDLPYSDRERRVRDAVDARYPTPYKDGMPNWESMTFVRDVFEDRVIISRSGKLWRVNYSIGSDLSVTFEGEPVEVIYTDQDVAALSSEGRTMKLKNAQGQEIDIPAASFAGFTLDALAADIPAVREAVARIPAAGTKIVSAVEFDALTTQVQTLSSTVNAQGAKLTAAETELAAAKIAARDAEINGLIAAGKILPADREHLIELANDAPKLYEKRIAQLKAAQPVITLGVEHGRTGVPAAGGAVVEFDNAVAAERTADTKIDTAEAIKRAAAKHPALAQARNRELSIPIGPGGVALSH